MFDGQVERLPVHQRRQKNGAVLQLQDGPETLLSLCHSHGRDILRGEIHQRRAVQRPVLAR